MVNRSTAAFVLSLIGGILVLVSGVLITAAAALMGAVLGTIAESLGAGADAGAMLGTVLIVTGVVIVVLGLLMIVGAVKIRKPAKQRTWGIIVLILSIVAALFGGGFYFVGSILGIIGALLALTNKRAAA